MDGSVRSRISANMIAFGFVIIVLCLQAKPTDCKAAEHDEIDWKTSDYPFMAFVSRLKKPYEKDEFKTCSGCLVTQNQVITSAYCTYDQRRNVSTQVEVRHPVFCNNGTTSFVRRNATSITYMVGYENDLNRQMAIINLNPLDMTECKAKIVKIEINRYASRKVRLVSAGVYYLGILTWSEDLLVKWNASIVSLELMKMYYGSLEYGIVFDDGGTMDKTDYAAAILDLESNNFLGFVIDKNPEILTQSVYKAFYFYPELEEFIKKHFGEDGYVPQRLNVSHTDESVTYNQRLNVSKPAKFSYTLREVEWTDHPYIVQVCNSQTKQIYSATLVDNNTVVTTPKCITDRTTGGLNDTFVVTHYAQNRITE